MQLSAWGLIVSLCLVATPVYGVTGDFFRCWSSSEGSEPTNWKDVSLVGVQFSVPPDWQTISRTSRFSAEIVSPNDKSRARVLRQRLEAVDGSFDFDAEVASFERRYLGSSWLAEGCDAVLREALGGAKNTLVRIYRSPFRYLGWKTTIARYEIRDNEMVIVLVENKWRRVSQRIAPNILERLLGSVRFSRLSGGELTRAF